MRKNTKMAQKFCPDGAWVPILRNESVIYVWGRRPPTCFSFVLRNLGPQISSRHQVCTILLFVFALHLRMDQHRIKGKKERHGRKDKKGKEMNERAGMVRKTMKGKETKGMKGGTGKKGTKGKEREMKGPG